MFHLCKLIGYTGFLADNGAFKYLADTRRRCLCASFLHTGEDASAHYQSRGKHCIAHGFFHWLRFAS